ncbi:exportin-6-A [Chironomus tepperi]|uniref:exportin-6-A n=1 Tax=Chironomus tepperi TaxID=113505 RepID=UPI00391FB8B8
MELEYLEALLNEFYHHGTSNFRKKEIEAQLKEFQEHSNASQICIQNLTNSYGLNNQFIFFFSVSTIEFTITKQWFNIDKKLRIHIRDTLFFIYCNLPSNVGALQRDKLAQLIALIGKREFPSEHAEYVNQILSLTKMKFILGINLLKSTSNEICSTKVDCSHQQKSKFVQSMILCLNDIMTLLGKFLTLCVCHVSNNELIVGPEMDFDMHRSLPNDERFSFCCSELLNTIASIFSWVPSNMETTMNIEFFNNIYELSTFTSEKCINVHLTAITTICELFYLQKQIPQLNLQANGITELIQQKNLAHSPEEYQDKLTELLKLFIQQQWSRFVNQPEFPSKEFLLHLFSFTFSDNISALTFGERLSLWIPIIKSFDEKIAPRYTETIVQLISNVILKMQFQNNSELLDLLDTEEMDENMETELQSFRNNCIEIVLTAAEIEPCKIFDLLNIEFTKENGHLKNFVNLLSTLPDFTKDLTVKRVSLSQIVRYSTDPSFHLHCMCKDLTTLLQMVTQTCNVILVITCDRNNSITNLIRTCIILLKLANQKKLHLYDLDVQLKTDLIELQAQILTTVRGLMLLRTEIYENHNEIFELIESVMSTLLPSHYGFIEPPLVLNTAVQLMVTITTVLRPNYFLKNQLVQELFHSDLSRFDEQIRLQIKQVVFNALVLPYSNIAVNLTEEQEYEKRGELLQQYVGFISYKFLSLNVQTNYIAAKLEIRSEMKDYEHLLNSYENTNNYSKQILLSSINPIIKKSIEIFQFAAKNYSHDENDLSMIINFNLSIVKCLQVQLGSDFVINIVRLFLEIASTPNRSAHALNKLLEMLIFIVQHTGTTSTHLMPDILKLTVDDLLRINPQIDISYNLFSLYDTILQNHWNYFQKNLSNTRNSQEDLMKIFTTYGQFLCNGSPIDPHIGRVIMASLESLNEKWHLYDKAFFKNSLLKSFMCTLLRLIISSDGILFYDQIITILFNMSENNKPALHECLAALFTDKTKIVQLCEVTDLPTFANIMEILIQDSHVAHQ